MVWYVGILADWFCMLFILVNTMCSYYTLIQPNRPNGLTAAVVRFLQTRSVIFIPKCKLVQTATAQYMLVSLMMVVQAAPPFNGFLDVGTVSGSSVGCFTEIPYP
jgi:hypothetical protein